MVMNPSAGMEIDETHFAIPIKPESQNFPSKLWDLVNNPEICSICWDPTAEGILIYQKPFEAEVIFAPNSQSKYFKMTDFSSFIRQLNLYGFSKVRPRRGVSDTPRSHAFARTQIHHFHNPSFKRANPELLVNIKRLTAVNRAKLAGGKAAPSQSSRHSRYPLMYSPQENSAVLEQGSVLVENQGTPHHHGSQQVKNCDRTPKPSQEFLMVRRDPGYMFDHAPLDPAYAQPSGSMHEQQGFQSVVTAGMLSTFLPHYSQYRFYPLVHSNMPCSQKPDESYTPFGYYPDYKVSFLQYTDQNPNWQAVDSQERRESDMNLDTIQSGR